MVQAPNKNQFKEAYSQIASILTYHRILLNDSYRMHFIKRYLLQYNMQFTYLDICISNKMQQVLLRPMIKFPNLKDVNHMTKASDKIP